MIVSFPLYILLDTCRKKGVNSLHELVIPLAMVTKKSLSEVFKRLVAEMWLARPGWEMKSVMAGMAGQGVAGLAHC